jgi:DNA-binding CsgD family transcriptional regulator
MGRDMSKFPREPNSGGLHSSGDVEIQGSLPRLIVDERAFYILPLINNLQPDEIGDQLSEEHARFELCGRTFLVIGQSATKVANLEQPDGISARLTGRELQIAVLVARGDPAKRIAYKLGIKEWTVREYLRRIFAKLHVHSKAAMVYQCAELVRRLEHKMSQGSKPLS